MKIDNWIGAIWCGLCVIALLVGLVGGFALAENRYQNAAFERGYAEWVLPEGGRGKTVWGWIDDGGRK